MTMHYPVFEEIVRRDPRYDYWAYPFVLEALKHTLKMLERIPPEEPPEDAEVRYHVTPREWLEGICDLATEEFGFMARTVFHRWGIECTDHFGDIVFNLVEAGLISKNEEDERRDFQGVFDLDEKLVRDYRIVLDDGE